MLTTGHMISPKGPCTYLSIHSWLKYQKHDVLAPVTQATEIYLSPNQMITPLTHYLSLLPDTFKNNPGAAPAHCNCF